MGTGDPWLLVQHVAFEGPGAIAGAIADTGADLTVLRMDRDDALPSPAAMTDVAGLVVMGGPMSVHDDLPWLADERARCIRCEEIALIGDVVHVDVDAPVLCVVTKRDVCDEIRRDRVHVRDVAIAFPLIIQSAADVEA